MDAGEMLAGRYELEQLAGRGGMGAVFRARDTSTDRIVAAKILVGKASDIAIARFEREARVLSSITHPRIVGYHDHGVVDGTRYLIMDWLEGVDLLKHTQRHKLSAAEVVTIARGVAEALSHAHKKGILHRDVKLSNLFLPNGDLSRVMLLDFGIARFQAFADVTKTGMPVGTASYMSPEQARGLTNLDARSDVWSLGVLMYQMLTRRRPFWAGDPMMVIAKILQHDPPPPSSIVPDVPPALDDLVMRMLIKDPAGRPRDGRAVLHALEAISVEEMPGQEVQALTEAEQRLRCVLLVSGGTASGLDNVFKTFGGTSDGSWGGAMLVVLSSDGAATDLAARGARCALAIREEQPDAWIAVSVGRVSSIGEGLTGEENADPLVHQAAALLGAQTTVVGNAVRSPEIRVDSIVAGLLDGSFDVIHDAHGYMLRGRDPNPATARTLLGKPTRCVAREAEIATLQATFEAVADEPCSRAVLITAPAGVGKSRLRWEFLQRLRDSGEAVDVWLGRGDPLRAGAPYAILGSAIRSLLGILDGDDPAHSREIVRQLPLEGEDPAFIGELIGVPLEDEGVLLRAARRDPLLMRDQVAKAFMNWVKVVADARPLVLVLEDLHWGDLPTVRLLDRALRDLRDQPLMVIAFARPEVEELFPRLWGDRGVQHIRLGPIPKRAARRFVRQILESPSEETVDRIVSRAAGNALYLEELIRASAEGSPGELPETVLAMVQVRLESMETEARRILRAASVFGRVFWADGVSVLMGDQNVELIRWLEFLIDREVVTRRERARFADQHEFVFRHDLVKEAAYAMLTDEDRRLGHKLAATWLEEAGETEAAVLAKHYDLGGVRKRAANWYLHAANQALDSNDIDAVLERARRGLACGAEGPVRGHLLACQAEAHNWRGEFREAQEVGGAALANLAEGSAAWYATLAEMAVAAGVQGHSDELRDIADHLPEQVPNAQLDAAVLAGTRLAEHLIITGSVDHTGSLFRLFERAEPAMADEPAMMGRIQSARALRACYVGDVEGNARYVDEAVTAFEAAGDRRNACTKRERSGYTRMDMGDYESAEVLLKEALGEARILGLQNVVATARHNLGLTLGRLGKTQEAIDTEEEAALAFRQSGNRRMEGASYEYLALIRLENGDPPSAEIDARRAIALAETPTLLPLNKSESLAILARTLLPQGRINEALAAAREGLKMLEDLGGIDDGESIIRVTYADALLASGDAKGAAEATRIAHERLLERADRLSPAHRQRFLMAVPENRRTMELALELGVEGAHQSLGTSNVAK